MNTPEKVLPSTASWSTKPSQITNPQFPVKVLHNFVERVPRWCRSPRRKARSLA